MPHGNGRVDAFLKRCFHRSRRSGSPYGSSNTPESRRYMACCSWRFGGKWVLLRGAQLQPDSGNSYNCRRSRAKPSRSTAVPHVLASLGHSHHDRGVISWEGAGTNRRLQSSKAVRMLANGSDSSQWREIDIRLGRNQLDFAPSAVEAARGHRNSNAVEWRSRTHVKQYARLHVANAVTILRLSV